ncbi:unnamed protein product [Cunninghamella echinulata]
MRLCILKYNLYPFVSNNYINSSAGSQGLNETLLINMYQRPLDKPAKEHSFRIIDTTLMNNNKNIHNNFTIFINNVQEDNKDNPIVCGTNSADIDNLLSRLESLDLNKATFLHKPKITLTHPLFGEDFEKLLEATNVPKTDGVEELTKEENEIVDDIFKMHQTGIVSQSKTAIVEYKDIYKLYPETWLNDEIINFYMELLTKRSNEQSSSSLSSIHCFNTFFCSTLRDQGYDKVRRWTKKVDIFDKELLLIPINYSYHWTLGVIDMAKKTVAVYDSLNGNHDSTIQLLFNYLEMEHMDKKKRPFDKTNWVSATPSNIPQQQNMSDCGVFTCMFAERLSRNHPFDFSQKDMTAIRRRMALDIKRKKLSV